MASFLSQQAAAEAFKTLRPKQGIHSAVRGSHRLDLDHSAGVMRRCTAYCDMNAKRNGQRVNWTATGLWHMALKRQGCERGLWRAERFSRAPALLLSCT